MADLDLAAPAVRPPDAALSLGRAVVEMDDRQRLEERLNEIEEEAAAARKRLQ